MKYYINDQLSMTSEAELEEKVRQFKLNPLQKLDELIDFEFFRGELESRLGINRTKSVVHQKGRPRFDVVMMFKILILQSMYNISDDQMEYQINDRISFRQFLGLKSHHRIPDAKTIWLYRDDIGKDGGIKKLFDLFNGQLIAHQIILKEGQMVDASFVEVPVQRNSREENKEIKEGNIPAEWQAPEKKNMLKQKDTDARWTKKNNKSHFGYKDHVLGDYQTKLITDWCVTAASVHDSVVFQDLLNPHLESLDGLRVWADSAYYSEAAEEFLAKFKINSQVHERAYRNRPLTDEQKEANHGKSTFRVRVEHIFGYMTNSMNGMTARARSLVRVEAAIGLKNLAYNLNRLTQIKGEKINRKVLFSPV